MANLLRCTVCGAQSRLMAWGASGSLFRCPACDHCFSGVETMPEQERYDDAYYEDKHRAWFENPNIALFDFILERVRRVKSGASVLDVGAGRGDFLKYLRAKDPRLSLTGIDVSPITPSEGISFLQGDALSLPEERAFDAVVSLAVIEHIADIHAFIKKLRDLCAPGGVVVVMTLDDRSVLYTAARWLRALGMTGPFDRLYERHHLNHFNAASLRRLLELEGLAVVETLHHDIPMAAVDLPAVSPLKAAVYRAGVRGAFALGELLGRTYLQTVVCRRAA